MPAPPPKMPCLPAARVPGCGWPGVAPHGHEPEFGELELVCPDGQMLHPLDWDSQRPLSLLKNVQRLTAPTPA